RSSSRSALALPTPTRQDGSLSREREGDPYGLPNTGLNSAVPCSAASARGARICAGEWCPRGRVASGAARRESAIVGVSPRKPAGCGVCGRESGGVGVAGRKTGRSAVAGWKAAGTRSARDRIGTVVIAIAVIAGIRILRRLRVLVRILVVAISAISISSVVGE